MQRLLCAGLVLLLFLSGCLDANRGSQATAATQTAAAEPAPASSTNLAPETEATSPAVPETTIPPDLLAGVEMELSEGLMVTPGTPGVEMVISFPKVDPRLSPDGLFCELTLDLDGETIKTWPELRLRQGAEERLDLEFSFDRYTPSRDVVVTATLRCGERFVQKQTTLSLVNYPEELYLQMSEDKTPYSIDVLRNQNLVIVYGRDADNEHTVPVKVWLCSTGRSTPRGNYRLGAKWEWGHLFGDVYGQYVCGIIGDILFHSVPYERKEKDSLETEEFNKLGTTASMGCIRLAVGDVKWIYDNCPSGTPIHIYDADELPEGVERPTAFHIDPEDPWAGWDPTDPDENNPWNATLPDANKP